jgi:predicted O-methyltransferase YrrM
MANGISSLFIASALQANGTGRHFAIDPFQSSDWDRMGLELLKIAGLDSWVEVIEKPSHQALPQLEQAGVRAQFIFIDGSHLFDYVMTDFLCADRVLDVGGLIAFDDSDWPAIESAIRYIIANRHYQVAFPDVVIERTMFHPRLPARLLRATGRRIPKLGEKLRSDFLTPSYELGIRGRCVVLRKMAADDRNSQSRFHCRF